MITHSKQPRLALTVAILVIILRIPLQALLAPIAINDGRLAYFLALAVTELLLFGLPGLLLVRIGRCSPRQPGRDSILVTVLSPLAGMAAFVLLSTFVSSVWNRWFPDPGNPVLLPAEPAALTAAVLILTVLTTVTEELFFRGSMYHLLRPVGRVWALLLTTLIFALMHGSRSALPAHLGISLLLTLVMARSGSLLSCILLHTGFNAANLLWATVLPQNIPLLPLCLVCGAICAGYTLLLLRQPVAPDPDERVRADGQFLFLSVLSLLLCAVWYLL